MSQIRCLFVVLCGVVSSVGCGGMPEAEGPDVAGDLAPSGPLDEYLETDEAGAGEGAVGAATACCFIKCSDLVWRGPYKNVKYGNCTAWGKYQCPAIGQTFVAAKWDNC
ncbi:hypothetical protein LY474_30455 [Myxococcus stipitatus]|uniref:hypothetical protein n=1 Tax=Myxococcus stipitatus TaxID=83455 RepID=UPI001F1EDE5E|nr:hypothetical protein [Myxococcus stipitatus]MCE9672137.1 hypothetical protein [Myxococcus stipitatus]